MGDTKTKHPLSHFADFLSQHRDALWAVLLYAAALGLLSVATPIAVQALVNSVAFGSVLQPLAVLSALVLSVLVIMGVLWALKAWVVEVLQRRLFVDTVARMAFLLPRRDWNAAQALAEPTHRYFEVFSIQKACASLLLGGTDAVLAALVGLLVLAFYHPLLLAFDVALMLAIGFIVFGLGRNGVRSAVVESTAKYRVASFLSDVERLPLAFRDEFGERFAHERLDALTGEYLNARRLHYRVVLRQLIGALALQAFASATLLGLGGYLVMRGQLTLGQLVAAELIVSLVVTALSDLSKYLETYYDLVAGVYKLDHVHELPTEPEPGEPSRVHTTTGPAALSLIDVRLNVGSRALLEHASLELSAGARSILTGPPESGKTTLLDMLYGARIANSGAVLIDGVHVQELTRATLRRRVAVVRGAEVASGTVIDNVRLGNPALGTGAVRTALDRLGLLAELEHLPDGLETRVGNGGFPLSHSQALRLTVARAMAREPGLFVLDADFSSMASRTLETVLAALTRPDAPWTLIMVGDSPALRAVSTHELCLADGRIEQGACA
jgi:putative ABC transport system ATP-binding protein